MNGVSTAVGVATEWSPEKNIRWRTELPGPAGATPVAAGGKLFLTAAAGSDLLLCAYDQETGQEVWRRTVSTGAESFRGDEGNLASPSPTTDGERVVAVMGDGVMSCYSVDGEPLWKVDLNRRLGPLDIQFGYSSTPVLHEGRVLLQWIHGDGDASTKEARVACFDADTGASVWTVPRVTEARMECEHSYASPIVAGDGPHAMLVTHGADYTIAYRLTDGIEKWRLGGLNPIVNYSPVFRFVASPAFADGLVVTPTCKNGAVVGVSIEGEGDITNGSQQVWRNSGGTPDVPSPVIHEGLVYLCGENGNLTCLEARTGQRIYRKRTVADRHRASPVLADGKIFLTSRAGVVTVVRTGRDFEILAKNDLGEKTSASPVVIDGVIYLRTFDALYAIAGQPETAGE